MRVDDLVAYARVVGQGDAKDGLRAVGPPALVEDVGDGFGAEGTSRVRVAGREVERRGAVGVEES